MEQQHPHLPFEESSDDDDRAAFHRMLLQNAPATPTIALKPKITSAINETAQAAYTHGLEVIYALESVDPSSIRRIHSTPEPIASLPYQTFCEPDQLELDFGLPYREWVEPLVFQEPINVLELSHHAEKVLLDNKKYILADLLELDVHLPGLGQGHLDDIHTKLQAHIAGRDLKRSTIFDLEAFVRSLFRSCDRRALFVFLQDFGLQNICTLSTSAAAEVRRAGQGRLAQWKDEARCAAQTPEATAFFWSHLKESMEALVSPWIRRRGGIVTKSEILERLNRVTLGPQPVIPFLSCMKSIYSEDECLFERLYLSPTPGIYCADAYTKDIIQQSLKCAKSYFYQKNLVYPIGQLSQLVLKDLAKQWIQPSEEVLHKALSLCSIFHVRKDLSHKLIVRLASTPSN